MNYYYGLVVFSVILSGIGANLTKSIFYKADALEYTSDFCKNIQNKDFISAIGPDSGKEAEKTKAFKVLFDSCRFWLLHDAVMAKNVIITLVDTDNSEHLPILLLDQDDPKTKEHNLHKNIDLSSEIWSIVLHLFTINPSLEPSEFFFQTRNPHKALSYILAYTTVDKEDLERVREFLEAINNHPTVGHYTDATTVAAAITIVDRYLKHPEAVGNHKPLAFSAIDKQRNWLTAAGIILGLASIGAIGIGLLCKWNSNYKAVQ